MKEFARCAMSVTLAGLAVLLAVPSAPAAEFAADLVRSGEGEEGDVSRIFVKGDLRREEVLDEEEVGAISITRPDKGLVWNLMPDEKMYMALPMTMAAGGGIEDIKRIEALGTMRVLGKEDLEGFECEVREYPYNEMGVGSIKVWYALALDFPIKIVQHGPPADITLEYRNITVKAVPDSMFEIPPDYVKMEIPGMDQMPSGMPTYPDGE